MGLLKSWLRHRAYQKILLAPGIVFFWFREEWCLALESQDCCFEGSAIAMYQNDIIDIPTSRLPFCRTSTSSTVVPFSYFSVQKMDIQTVHKSARVRARDNKEDWMSIWIVENWGRNSRLRVVFLLSFSIHTFLRWKKQLSDFHSPLTLVIYDGAGRSKNFRVCRKKSGRNGKNFTTKESKNFLYYDVSLLCKTTFTTLEKKVSSVRKSRQDIVVITLKKYIAWLLCSI